MEDQMPRIEELSSKAHDLYWQIEDWMSDFDIPEERVEEALCAAAKLDEELTRLYKDLKVRELEAEAAGAADSGSMPLAARSSSGPSSAQH